MVLFFFGGRIPHPSLVLSFYQYITLSFPIKKNQVDQVLYLYNQILCVDQWISIQLFFIYFILCMIYSFWISHGLRQVTFLFSYLFVLVMKALGYCYRTANCGFNRGDFLMGKWIKFFQLFNNFLLFYDVNDD